MNIEELRKRFPLFTFGEPEIDGWMRVHIYSFMSIGLHIDKYSINDELKLKNYHHKKEQELLLRETYPNLHISIHDNKLSIWVSVNGRDGSAISTKELCCDYLDDSYLSELNQKAQLASQKPEDYFWCTECSQSLPRKDYADFVMAAEYCKKCADKPEVAASIKESHRAGFYD